jgi:hypothetical protein
MKPLVRKEFLMLVQSKGITISRTEEPRIMGQWY